MTTTPSMLYWITRCDHIREIFTVSCFLTTMALIICLFIIANPFDNNHEIRKYVKRTLCYIIPIISISVLCLIFIPKTQELCAMYVIPEITNNEKLKHLGNESIDYAIDWLKKIKSNKK